jgi:hypothetical protein
MLASINVLSLLLINLLFRFDHLDRKCLVKLQFTVHCVLNYETVLCSFVYSK